MNKIEISGEEKGEILDSFSRLAELLINSEREGIDGHEVEAMRILHNLKGTMQMIGYDELGEFIHLLESKFSEIDTNNLNLYVDNYLIAINSIEQHFIDEMDCYDDHLFKTISELGQTKYVVEVNSLVSDICEGVKIEEEEVLYGQIDNAILPEELGVVFVLDDEEDILKGIKQSFSNLNIVVMCFSNHELMISTMIDIRPDLILIDFHLNGLKGVDVYTRSIKSKEIPTIFMTSDLSTDTFENILKNKNVFFLEKPLRYFEVISSVVSALEQSKMRDMMEKMIDLERSILSHFPEIKESLEAKADFKSIYEIREAYRLLMKYRKILMR